MFNFKKLTLISLVTAASVLAHERPAEAVLNYYIYEFLGSVIVETSGSLNLPLTPTGSSACGLNGILASAPSLICTGPSFLSNSKSYSLVAPASFGGSANLFGATTSSGTSTFLLGLSPEFGVVSSYVNNTPIISNAVYNGQSLSGLGFNTPGLVGTWALAGTLDTINVCVGVPGSPCGAGAPTATPGPLPLLGAGAAFGFSRRLRRRVSQGRSAAPSATSISV